jgi:lipid II isoglutaminyl synthase (glutamine-hydrolysing)
VSTVTITVAYLYPEPMSAYGDRGNVETVRRRCAWRGIDVVVRDVLLGDLMPADVDLIMIGGGGESQQRLVAADLYKVKSRAIRDAVAAGAAALAVGGGFELFGRFCQPEYGAEYPGIDLFDSWTIRQPGRPGTAELTTAELTAAEPTAAEPTTVELTTGDDANAEASAGRHFGELIVRWGTSLLVGFENHSGGTYLGATALPLGQVLAGHGNNGGGGEGVILGGAVGTNLSGPCLPKNPALADYLIGAAVARRHAGEELARLPDELEQAAREVAVQEARQAARASRRQLTRLLPRPRSPRGQQRPGQFPPGPLRPGQQRPASPRPSPTGRR